MSTSAKPTFVVQFRLKGTLRIDACTFGPFQFYSDAEEFLATLPLARDCEHKFIDTLVLPTRENAASASEVGAYLQD